MNIVQYNLLDYKVLKYLAALFVIMALSSCGGTNTQVNSKNYNELQELISSREFEVEHQWAFPNGGGNINLIGNPNSIKFMSDSIDIYLPYFGVRHTGGTYGGTDGGIKYKGPVKNLEIEENTRKGNIEVKFEAKQNNENLDFRMTFFPNNKVRTNVISSQRTTMSYEGRINGTAGED
ncbi:DUF4251 domain-containing protein [Christiangramia echinicola]|uniref:DUF4251 domain-containing protein n=1 Tax=Christiangramia echinicola TaxID=279359 RepID=A0A1H1RVA3_9FLAO|nr:DUF4251 domain-containing protein [Christiangramia echinicola]SDS39476.1 protein of unknown function [Christiangramia echinicola]